MTIAAAISVAPIGVIRSEFKSKVGVPIQTAGAPQLRAELEVLPDYVAGLRDLDERIGWFASKLDQLPGKRSDDRMR